MSSKSLSQPEQAAVAEYVRAEYDRLIAAHPNSYVARNAQVDPKGWQDKLRELVACDSKRVAAIVELSQRSGKVNGFTLIELSIVLVIIGLIVGGVLVGRDLISAAAARAQITQIDNFNTATNTFFQKYGFLPGDIPDPAASNFGFQPRGTTCPGEGDGNGIIQGVYSANCSVGLYEQNEGETAVFWVDLSTAHLIEGGFSLASETVYPGTLTATSTPSIAQFFPAAKIGRSNFIYVYGGQPYGSGPNGTNYYGLSAITQVSTTFVSSPALTVQEAYSIDKKVDDGLPQTGRVTTDYVSPNGAALDYQSGLPNSIGAGSYGPNTTAVTGSSSTCFDNGGVNGATPQYSVEINNGNNVTCALSFRMQAGD